MERNFPEALCHILDDQVADIYRKYYWGRVAGSALSDGLDFAVFDTAVNMGPAQAVRLLQRIVGMPADGVIGPKTIAAVDDYVDAHGVHQLIAAYIEARQSFYRLQPTYVHFGEGWRQRADGIAMFANNLRQKNTNA